MSKFAMSFMNCGICSSEFSTDPSLRNAPSSIKCGHYICKECFTKHSKYLLYDDITAFYCKCGDGSIFRGRQEKIPHGFIASLIAIRAFFDKCEASNGNNLCERCSSEKKPYINIDSIEGLNCANCSGKFTETLPIVSSCGHYMCGPCVKSTMRKPNRNCRESKFCVDCPKCTISTHFNLHMDGGIPAASGFSEIVKEVQCKVNETKEEHVCKTKKERVECAQCGAKNSTNKARVCLKCYPFDGTLKAVCASCVLDSHLGPDHDLKLYNRFKGVCDNLHKIRAVHIDVRPVISHLNEKHMKVESGFEEIKNFIENDEMKMSMIAAWEKCENGRRQVESALNKYDSAIKNLQASVFVNTYDTDEVVEQKPESIFHAKPKQ